MKIKVVTAGKCMICGKLIKVAVPIDHDKLPNICLCRKCEPKEEYDLKRPKSEKLKGENK